MNGVDWAIIAYAEAALIVIFGGIIWHNVSNSLEAVANALQEVAKQVHGHGIRLDHLDRENGK